MSPVRKGIERGHTCERSANTKEAREQERTSMLSASVIRICTSLNLPRPIKFFCSPSYIYKKMKPYTGTGTSTRKQKHTLPVCISSMDILLTTNSFTKTKDHPCAHLMKEFPLTLSNIHCIIRKMRSRLSHRPLGTKLHFYLLRYTKPSLHWQIMLEEADDALHISIYNDRLI